MRLIYILTEMQGEEYPFSVTAMPDDNFGENYDEEGVLWWWSFKTEVEAKSFIRDIKNAPVLRQTIDKNGVLIQDEYENIDAEYIGFGVDKNISIN
jgi:hypothetical protein